MKKFFGTDGIRGTTNTVPMTVEIAQKLGQAAGVYFKRGNHRHSVLLGKDTRLSGYMIENALVSGFLSSGMDVTLVGPLPTPAIAMLTRSLRADLGIMISASHNPYSDNGIKLFGPDGFKLSDQDELSIEALMATDLSPHLAHPDKIGRASRLNDAAGRYVESAKAAFPRKLRLDGIRVVIDCANGSAYRVAPTALWELGAEVIRLGCDPNGININDHCGSTYPYTLGVAVQQHNAHIGIALDGDADRVVIVDETGHVIDGDQILALITQSWLQEGRLTNNAIVSTIMSNMGLERFLETLGITLERTSVGDRHVMERMRQCGINIGGEQSGHMVLTDFSTTGDGLIAALQVLEVLVKTNRPASEICRIFHPFPQTLRNIRYQGKCPIDAPLIRQRQQEIEQRLAGKGRLVLRRSGTEPLIRVMVEAETQNMVNDVATLMCSALEEVLKHSA
ncbi:MAG: phosphoglucosamine mutase [Acetobacter sp.]|nr:phosphoglucosamine mutase [Acetobacter sp.]